MLVSISAKKKQTSQQTGSAYREDTKQAVNRYSHSVTAINKCTCSDLTWEFHVATWSINQNLLIHALFADGLTKHIGLFRQAT